MKKSYRSNRLVKGHGSPRLNLVLIALAVLALALPAGAQLNQTVHRDGWILAAAHAPGSHGSIWRTDLWVNVVHGVDESTTVDLYFCPRGEDNTDVEPVSLELTPGVRFYYLEDVLDQFLSVGGGSWVGAIHYVANADVQVWARVYSISADGSASYGQLVEGIPTADMTPDNDPWISAATQWLFAMRHTADGRYRVNVGIVNPTPVRSQYTVRIFDETGSNPGGGGAVLVRVEVPPYSMTQLSDPFADVSGGEWSAMAIRVECTTEGGGAFAYASVVDNATNDAYFVRGVKQMRPDE